MSKPSENEHWGSLADGSDLKSELQAHECISPKQKLEKLKMINTATPHQNNQIVTIDNPLVTQAIEVINQTEFIQTLLETYASDSQTSFLNQNEGIFMPHIDVTPDTTANLVSDHKFLKPLWYIPPHETDFTRGVPKTITKVSKPIAMEALRISISGLIRLKGFTESTDSGLQMFTDGVDEFYKCFMESVNAALINNNEDRNKKITIESLEKVFSMNNSSLTTLFNYYKNEIVAKNRSKIEEFKNVYQDYDKLMQENQNMQKTLNDLKSEMINDNNCLTIGDNPFYQYDISSNLPSYNDGSEPAASRFQ